MHLSNRAQKIINNINLDKDKPEDFFRRIADFYSNDLEHANRIYEYMVKKMFTPSTPVMANTPGKNNVVTGLPISCYLSQFDRNNHNDIFSSTMYISKHGGGLGTLWTDFNYHDYEKDGCREFIRYGLLPNIQVQGKLMKITSGYARKSGSVAVYLDVNHPEIMNFISMRKSVQGIDPTQIIPRFIHHAVVLTDDFMNAVLENKDWDLIDGDNNIAQTVKARHIWEEIIKTRVETGEPYIMWKDNVNRQLPKHLKKLGLTVNTSNLCTEITLPTGKDHRGKNRIAICNLGSMNLVYYDQFNEQFIKDIMEFVDNVITKFIHLATKYNVGDLLRAEDRKYVTKEQRDQEEQLVNEAMEKRHPIAAALYSAHVERSVGIGTTGFHSYIQKNYINIDSAKCQERNREIFQWIHKVTEKLNVQIAHERGSCKDAIDAQCKLRLSHVTAIAPTKNIATIQGVSENIELTMPIYSARGFNGSFIEKNPLLEQHLEKLDLNTPHTWNNILMGKYDNIPHMEVFKGPYDVDQNLLIRLASQRPIDQSQSFNTYFSTPVDLKQVSNSLINAWKLGIKTQYYQFSTAKLETSQFAMKDLDNHLNDKIICEGCQ